jgi:general secretion pathway protein G
MKSFANKNRGFTLIEILIVMAILAMLAALVGPALFSNLGKGQRSAAATQMDLLGQGLDVYKLDVGRYPRELNGLIENDTGRDVWSGPYLRGADAIPKDPWGNDYVYTPGDDDFDLLTYGADGAPGGEGDDADIEQ